MVFLFQGTIVKKLIYIKMKTITLKKNQFTLECILELWFLFCFTLFFFTSKRPILHQTPRGPGRLIRRENNLGESRRDSWTQNTCTEFFDKTPRGTKPTKTPWCRNRFEQITKGTFVYQELSNPTDLRIRNPSYDVLSCPTRRTQGLSGTPSVRSNHPQQNQENPSDQTLPPSLTFPLILLKRFFVCSFVLTNLYVLRITPSTDTS